MEQPFADYEIMIIEKEVTKKSFRDIAFLLDRPVNEVTAFINQWSQDKNITTLQQQLDEKKKTKAPVVRLPREKKKKDLQVFSRIIIPDQKQKKNRKGEIIFKTRVVDLSRLQEVRIDNKTCIYVKPGQDPVEAKERYLERLRENRSRFVESDSKQVANFKL